MSQKQLAAAMNVSRPALTHWENDVHRPTEGRLLLLSQVLKSDLIAAALPMKATPADVQAGLERAAAQQCDASLLETFSPLWRPRAISVLKTRESKRLDVDLLILPMVAFHAGVDQFALFGEVTSGIVVEGDKLRPSFAHGGLMLLGGGSRALVGDFVLALGRLEENQRPAQFGRLVERQGLSVTISPVGQNSTVMKQSSEYEALFRVIIRRHDLKGD